MRRAVRFLLGVTVGGVALAAYLSAVGVGDVLDRVAVLAPWAALVVVALVVLEHVVDGLGVWASVRPLGDGLSPPRSVQYALAGDFFDILSPAGPVTSEPIMARFFSVATETGYSEALGVRSVAKYVKSGTQLLLSVVLGAVVLLGGSGVGTTRAGAESVLLTLGGAIVGLAVLGVVLVRFREALSVGIVAVGTPVVVRVSGLYREEPYDRAVVVGAVERFWDRIVGFGGTPGLVGLIALGGVAEQLLTAAALWVALAGTGNPVAFLPIVVLVPLPQVASVVPIPASLGAYDVLMSGALVLATGAPAVAATAAVLVVRTVSIPFGLGAGGLAASFMTGWTPRPTDGD